MYIYYICYVVVQCNAAWWLSQGRRWRGGGVTSLLTASNTNRYVLVSIMFPRRDSVHLAQGDIVCWGEKWRDNGGEWVEKWRLSEKRWEGEEKGYSCYSGVGTGGGLFWSTLPNIPPPPNTKVLWNLCHLKMGLQRTAGWKEKSKGLRKKRDT